MAVVGDISQITLPSGNTYNIKDAVARAAINGIFVIAWKGDSDPSSAEAKAKIPAGVKVKYGTNAERTGTLVASADTLGKFYLVKSSSQQDPTLLDVYDEYITYAKGTDPETYDWEKIGDTQIKLSEIITSVTPSSSKLVTTTVTGVSGSTTASRVSNLADQTTISGFSSNNTTDAFLKGWSVNNEVLTFNGVSATSQTTKQIKIDTESVTVPVAAASATTVATGDVSNSGTGATVVTSVSVS